MIHRIITEQELKELEIEGVTDTVKSLIEHCISELSEGGVKDDALRGFLVQLCYESIIDDALRAELPDDAASFSEGWDAALKFGEVQNAA